jgi:SAM-dependent methyltransferase
MNCHICGAAMVPQLRGVADSLTGDRFDIQRCAECHVGQTVPMPDDLGRYYASYHGDRHGITASYRVWRRWLQLHQAAGKGDGRRLLDIGCGDGSFLLAAKKAGWQVCGTELKPDMARAAGLDVRSEIEQFGSSELMACVTLWHSLEHLPDPRGTLLQVHDRLEPDGTLLISVPDNGGWQARFFGRNWVHLDVPRHLYHFDRRSLGRLLDMTGFVVQGQWHQELEYDLMGWSQSALNTISREPNIFYSSLIGRPVHVGKPLQIAHLAAGLILTAGAVPLVAMGILFRRGGTLIVAARPRT